MWIYFFLRKLYSIFLFLQKMGLSSCQFLNAYKKTVWAAIRGKFNVTEYRCGPILFRAATPAPPLNQHEKKMKSIGQINPKSK